VKNIFGAYEIGSTNYYIMHGSYSINIRAPICKFFLLALQPIVGLYFCSRLAGL